MRYAVVLFKESSAVGSGWVPILYFNRCTKMPLLTALGAGWVASGKRGMRRGTRKRDSEREPSDGSPVRARAMETLESVALENHLKPSSLYSGPKADIMPVAVALVSVWDTSEPPGR